MQLDNDAVKINIRKLFALLMIVFGALLEIYFYVFRFTQDGISVYVALVISVALNLLMALAVYGAQEHRLWITVVIIVGAYSVFSTSAGQTFSLLNRDNSVGVTELTRANVVTQTNNAHDIALLDKEAESITTQLGSIQADIATVAKYRTTIKQLNDRLTAIGEQKRVLNTQANRARNEEIVANKQAIIATNIYEFYATMATWNNTERLKFIFHTILSLFIAIMTPLGILVWPKERSPKVADSIIAHLATKEREQSIAKEAINAFVYYTWYNARRGNNTITPKRVTLPAIVTKYPAFTEAMYEALIAQCIAHGFITAQGGIAMADEEFVKGALIKEVLK